MRSAHSRTNPCRTGSSTSAWVWSRSRCSGRRSSKRTWWSWRSSSLSAAICLSARCSSADSSKTKALSCLMRISKTSTSCWKYVRLLRSVFSKSMALHLTLSANSCRSTVSISTAKRHATTSLVTCFRDSLRYVRRQVFSISRCRLLYLHRQRATDCN